MRSFRRLFFLVLLALAALPALRAVDSSRHISQYGHTAWLRKDGFLSGIPRVITQTTDGYLWIGTTEGLSRFDGVRFVPWAPPAGQSIPSDRINYLLAARDGSLWIGTALGISRWKDGSLTNISGPAGVVPSILEAKDGTIWFVLYRSKGPQTPLCQVVSSGMRCYGAAQGIPEGNYSPLVQDRNGSFWIGGDKGLVQWSPHAHSTFVPTTTGPKDAPPKINWLQNGPDGSLWVAVNGTGRGHGLQQFAQGAWKDVAAPGFDGSSADIIRLLSDRDNVLWIATTDHGIYRLAGNSVDHLGSQDGLSGDFVLDFHEDHEGNLWIATNNGIDMFRALPVTSFSVREGLKNQEIDAVLAGSDNSIWIGGSALDILDHGNVKSIVKGKGLPGGLVTSLFEDHDGRTWIGIDDTLTVYHNGRFRKINTRSGKPMGMVSGITEDTDHNIWATTIGSTRGLYRIQGLAVVEEFLPPQTPPARRIAADTQSGIWRGLRYGEIERRAHGRIDSYHYPHDPETRVEQITVNPDGSVLGASPPGLIGWKDGRQLTMTTHNGLPCITVYSFVVDNHGDLWLNMQCGIVRIPVADLRTWWDAPESLVHPKIFDALDGAQPDVVPFQSGAVKSTDGRLWFAASVLLQMIDPDHLATNSIVPPVQIEQVVADRAKYAPSSGLRLPPRPRDLEIDYTALSFTVPQKVRFRYMLEGYDAGWQDSGTRRQAFYTDLGPGSYRFRVVACNNDGLWNETGASLEFRVAPAWYQTLWFRVLCVVLAALLLWAIYRIRVRQIAATLSARFDERLAERTRLARELHDTFLQTVQGSKLVVDDALDVGADEDRMRRALEKLSRWLGQAVEEGRAALHSLRASTVEKNHLSEALQRATEDHQLPASMTAAFSMIGDPRDVHPIVRDEIYRIGYEAIRNAAAHSRGSRLEIDIHYANDLLLRIKDNGIGIDPDFADKGREGHFGLQGMRERASRIHGKLSIVSSANAGTEVTLIVPGGIVYREAHPSLTGKFKDAARRFFQSSRAGRS